jgi:hypothetical protein
MLREFIHAQGFPWSTGNGIEDRQLWFWSIFKLQFEEHEILPSSPFACPSIFLNSSNLPTRRERASVTMINTTS